MSVSIHGPAALLEGLCEVPESELAAVRPEIQCNNRDLDVISSQAIAAIQEANSPPTLFQRDRSPVWIVQRDADAGPSIEVLGIDAFRGYLGRIASWYSSKTTQDTVLRRKVLPPMEIVKDLLALKTWVGSVLPRLRGIIDRPTFGGIGDLIVSPGYDHSSQLWLEPAKGLVVPKISTTPSPKKIARAKELLLDDLLGDFPFSDEASKANALAFLLLPFVRPMIDGPTPLHLVEAACIGTGKGLLVDVIHHVATGRNASVTAEVGNDDEWRKTILALLLGGPEFILIDNINGFIDSGALAGALTARTIEDRVLHTSRTASAPVHCIWAATGNNVRLSRELARRTQLIRLVALTDRPWERPSDDFAHPDLRRWVAENRGTLIGAALTLCSAWVADGMPQGSVRTGSFEEWSGTMSGIMESIGVAGFMANAGELTEHGNDDEAKWSAFVLAWWETFGTKSVLTKDLVAMVADNDLLEGVLDANDDESNRKNKLGKQLRKQRDRYYGDLKIVSAGKASNGSQQLRLEARPGVEYPCLPVV